MRLFMNYHVMEVFNLVLHWKRPTVQVCMTSYRIFDDQLDNVARYSAALKKSV